MMTRDEVLSGLRDLVLSRSTGDFAPAQAAQDIAVLKEAIRLLEFRDQAWENIVQRIYGTNEGKFDASESADAFMDRLIQSGTMSRLQGGRCSLCNRRLCVGGDGAILGHAQDCRVRDYEALPLAQRENTKRPV